jgi:ribosomal protein S12 methylthiotransferase
LTRRTVHITSLGCAKNQVDSDVMAARLTAAGATLVDDPADADVLLVNSCTFIEDATQESVNATLGLGDLKTEGRAQRLVVAGCLAQRYGEKLTELMPEVDAVVGTGGIDRIEELCLTDESGAIHVPAPECGSLDGLSRVELHRGPSAYVKVGEGCSQRCSFCVIPDIRGPLRTRPIAEIVTEVQALVQRGVREVNLVGQDTTAFGRDRPGRERLPDLLRALDAVDGLTWIRLLYAYPARLSDRLIETMAGCGKVCAYLDIPLQHVDGGVLRAMGRGTSERTVRRVVQRLRDGIPGLTLRTTFLVGFPGESESAFARLMDFVAQSRFERVGVFAFSAEEGTVAAGLDGQLSMATAQARRNALMELQQGIHLEHNEALVGTRQTVLVDGYDEGPLLVGRTAAQAPEVDGQVILDGGTADAGELVEVEVVGVSGYDLVGVIRGTRSP